LASDICRGALGRGGRTGETGAVDAPILAGVGSELYIEAISRNTGSHKYGARVIGRICFIQKSLELLPAGIDADISIIVGFEYCGSRSHLVRVTLNTGILAGIGGALDIDNHYAGQNAYNGNYYQQFDQSKTFFGRLHIFHMFELYKLSVI
jgi:hypothetical protein